MRKCLNNPKDNIVTIKLIDGVIIGTAVALT